MIGYIHYSRYNRIRVVTEGGRVYYTDMVSKNCPYSNHTIVEFDIIDEEKSIIGNIYKKENLIVSTPESRV